MTVSLDSLLVFVMLLNLALTGASRIDSCIRLVALQGAALGLLPILVALVAANPESAAPHTSDLAAVWGLFSAEGGIGLRVLFLAVVSFALKGIVFPYLLNASIRAADIRQEVDPMIGYGLSLLVGILLMGSAFWLGNQMELPHPPPSQLALPAAFATTLIGLQLIVTRRRAVLQTVGYLVMENGIYIFGVALAHEQPLLVEMGVLLDVFVAVFVMGITMFHISREFDHLDVEQLSELKD